MLCTDENMKGPVPEAAHVIVKAGGLTLSKFMTRSIRLPGSRRELFLQTGPFSEGIVVDCSSKGRRSFNTDDSGGRITSCL